MYKKTLGGFIFVVVLLLACSWVLWDAFDGKDGPFRLTLGIDLRGGTELLYRLDLSQVEKSSQGDIAEAVKQVMMRRLDQYGTAERSITVTGKDRLLLELPGYDAIEIARIKTAVQEAGRLSFNLVSDAQQFQNDRKIAEIEAQMATYEEQLRRWAADPKNAPKAVPLKRVVAVQPAKPEDGLLEETKLVVEKGVGKEVLGKYVSNARRTLDENGFPAIGFEFQRRGRSDFAELTGENKGSRLAIILDGTALQVATIQNRISGPGILTGDFDDAEIKNIITILKAGSLPVKPILENETTVGSVLGSDSIAQGQGAMLVSLALVVVFMVSYYLAPGLVANLALVLNLVLLLTCMIIFRNTLTFPGLAGLLLTVGMSVDANILIFERIREERTRGRSLNQAVQTGFQRAFWTIFDANLTTLITAFILFQFGTGPVKGFAVVLSLGIIASFFTALFVSRLILSILMRQKLLTELRMLQFVRNPSVDFLQFRKVALLISGACIVIGIGVLLVRGKETLGIDFTGGTRLVINMKEPVSEGEIRDRLLALEGEGGARLFDDVQVQSLGEVQAGKVTSVSVRTRVTQGPPVAGAQDPPPEPAPEDVVSPEEDDVFEDDVFEDDAASEILRTQERFKQKVETALAEFLAPESFDGRRETPPDSGGQVVLSLVVHLRDKGPVTADGIKQALLAANYPVATVEPQPVSAGSAYHGFRITTEPFADGKQREIESRLSKIIKDNSDFELSEPFPKIDAIGSKVAQDLQGKVFISLMIAFAAIIMYVSIRFQLKFGLAAIVALVHDILFTVGIIAIADLLFSSFLNVKINLPMVAALLTVIGYSLNDTIVIFDRIRENTTGKKRGFDYLNMVNHSINQTLSRTLLTSATTFMVVLVLLIWGGESIQGFAFALCVGVVIGTFSSIYVASPALIHFNARAERRRELMLAEAAAKG